MPYVKELCKAVYTRHQPPSACDSGCLNYQLTMTVLAYMRRKGLSYQTCNDIVGALDNCKDEFRRRVQHPYEDKKIAENGDVYPEGATE